MAKSTKVSHSGSGSLSGVCTPIYLPKDQWAEAAITAIDIFPANAPANVRDIQRIGVLASKFWGARVSELTVGFLVKPTQPMIDKILAYANKWSDFSKAKFRYTADTASATVRISFGSGGYWSYLGTDCLQIPKNLQTMNLESFTLKTPDSEWDRVVVHEFGHALGCPHEHARRDIVNLLDEAKTISYFERTQGWTEAEIREQILMPLEDSSLMNPSPADVASIMTYQFPGSVTKSGKPIPGGMVLSATDRLYFAKTYPPDTVTPPPPPSDRDVVTLVGLNASGQEVRRFKAV